MRLVKRVCIVWLCLTVLIIGVRVYGATQIQQNPLTEFGFDVCNRQPCFVGIIAGITTEKEAHNRISKDFVVTSYAEGQLISGETSHLSFVLLTTQPTNKIQLIQFIALPNSGFPRLDSFIALYGLPCAVMTDRVDSFTVLELVYPSMILHMTGTERRLRLNGQFDRITLMNGENSILCIAASDAVNSKVRPWRGFAAAERYEPD